MNALIAAACEVRGRAYAPYSKYHVGAALRTVSGDVFVGCNVENSSFGVTMCAERVAVGAAVAGGHTEFTALALATAEGAAPCGACRQVLAEFCDDLPILLIAIDRENTLEEVRLSDLFPNRFSL